MSGFLTLLDFLERSLSGVFGAPPERVRAFRKWEFQAAPRSLHAVTWFHASSYGELEMLSPLIEDFIARGRKVGISVFSSSAIPALKAFHGKVVYAGFSPSELGWSALFEHFQVNQMILAKYDFWPGMIEACSRRKIKLVVINAQWRASLKWMKRIFSLLGCSFPEFSFSANSESHERGLKKHFPKAQILPRIDPRYERVIRRSKVGKPLPDLSRYPKPWGIVGSAWLEDLEALLPAAHEWNGTLIVVPHSLKAENLKLVNDLCEAKREGRFVIVSQIGILAELYGVADWAFVGGGFHSGIHSTIEPAVFGIPVACGPKRATDFAETVELTRAGILTVCENSAEIEKWVRTRLSEKPRNAVFADKRKRYADLLEDVLRIGVN